MAIQLRIPNPCHEPWTEMTPVQSDCRFCGICEKQVVDFSQKSDAEILAFIQNAQGKICGKFRPEQIARPLLASAAKPNKTALTGIAAGLAGILAAQQPVSPPAETQSDTVMVPHDYSRDVYGNVAIYDFLEDTTFRKISGKILDVDGSPLEGASIWMNQNAARARSDANGFFELKIPLEALQSDSLELSFRAYGLPHKSILLPPKIRYEDLSLDPKLTQYVLADASITGELLVIGDPKPISPLRKFFRRLFRLNDHRFK